MFALVDCNNFYASCERVFRPELEGKAIVILSNNDGCVVSRSNEAKSLGIPMGAPAFKFSKIFDENNVQVFSSNYALYGDMSTRVMDILTNFSPKIEIYSIDEAFLKFDDCPYLNFKSYGIEICKRIKKCTGIPVTIGFARTKALAKVATKVAKKFKKHTNSVYVIDSKEKRIKALKWLPVEDIWGIGPKHSARLKKLGVKKAFEFTNLCDRWVKKNMSIVELRLLKDLCGIPTLDLDQIPTKKSIATTRSFSRNYKTFDEIKERIVTFAVTGAEKLRKQKSICAALMVFIHSNKFQQKQRQYSRSVVIKLPFQTNSGIEITKMAVKGLKKIYKQGYNYKKAGVILLNISPQHLRQTTLFTEPDPRHKRLMEVMDNMNRTWGKSKIKLASQEVGRTWKMKQESLSKRYTTRLDEIIIVNCKRKKDKDI